MLVHNLTIKGIAARYEIFFFFFLVRLFDLCILLKQSQSSILAAFTNLRSGIIINPEFTYYTAFVALFLLQCDTLISCDSILFKFCFCGD